MYDAGIVQMVLDAGLMVKSVLSLLFAASLVTWAIICKKFLLLRRARKESTAFLDVFWKSRTLADAYARTKDLKHSSIASVFRYGYGELMKFAKDGSDFQGAGDTEAREMGFRGDGGCMANVERTLRKAINNEVHSMSRSLSVLATTASTAPFIGLFGTVWGIMAAFQGIGLRGSASLATVAPGISEALIATAAGLAAAIPAAAAYNYYASMVRRIEADMYSFGTDFSNLIEREYVHRLSSRKESTPAAETEAS